MPMAVAARSAAGRVRRVRSVLGLWAPAAVLLSVVPRPVPNAARYRMAAEAPKIAERAGLRKPVAGAVNRTSVAAPRCATNTRRAETTVAGAVAAAAAPMRSAARRAATVSPVDPATSARAPTPITIPTIADSAATIVTASDRGRYPVAITAIATSRGASQGTRNVGNKPKPVVRPAVSASDSVAAVRRRNIAREPGRVAQAGPCATSIRTAAAPEASTRMAAVGPRTNRRNEPSAESTAAYTAIWGRVAYGLGRLVDWSHEWLTGSDW